MDSALALAHGSSAEADTASSWHQPPRGALLTVTDFNYVTKFFVVVFFSFCSNKSYFSQIQIQKPFANVYGQKRPLLGKCLL